MTLKERQQLDWLIREAYQMQLELEEAGVGIATPRLAAIRGTLRDMKGRAERPVERRLATATF